MTDKDIIKAWEQHVHLAEYVDGDYCDCVEVSLIKETLNFINRLQTDIESLQIEKEHLVTFLIETEAENKKLQNILNDVLDRQPKLVADAEKYAVEEFAERLNKEAEEVVIDREGDFVFTNDKFYETVADWCKETSEDIVKEMVGEDNG